ncbi:MAG: hypothetical protein H6835_16265 [Planctomycetes bacterium]|nr:hypothetical protein [Planctomycetota bacterium]
MSSQIRRVDYFYTSVAAEAGAAVEVLDQLAQLGVNLLAFSAVPIGPMRTQLTLFPEDRATFENAAHNAGLAVDGPHPALLASGADRHGIVASMLRRLTAAGIEVYASTGMANAGCYCYLVHVRPNDIDRAVAALEA